MKTSGKIGNNGVYVSDNVEKRFETDIRTYIYETQNLLSLQVISFLVVLRTYQHPCIVD